ncbi:hypothetical protein CRG98_028528 [Punica granatum]|uniref:Uncharacterized protein n=1 Tax=Punica granatum TaxID=22663 RepID=A0A2I0J4E7_PUNGR|nr:hypothetical protein CRG98_028528 [Punica granatum]
MDFIESYRVDPYSPAKFTENRVRPVNWPDGAVFKSEFTTVDPDGILMQIQRLPTPKSSPESYKGHLSCRARIRDGDAYEWWSLALLCSSEQGVSRTQGIWSTVGPIPEGEVKLEEVGIGPFSRAMSSTMSAAIRLTVP